MNKQKFTDNGNHKFPLTTEALAFMQDQTEAAHKLTALAGSFIIITEPSSLGAGLVIVNGELMPLLDGSGKDSAKTIVVSKSDETINLGNGSFEGIVRTRYTASYAGVVKKNPFATAYSLSKFKTWKNLETLTAELEEAKKHLMPKGTITMWSGSIDEIPNGWELCDGENGTPNLQGRFIVGYGRRNTGGESKYEFYPVGDTGGASFVALDNANQIPPHRHVYVADSNALGRNEYKEAGYLGMGSAETGSLENVSASGSGAGASAYTSYSGGSAGRDGKSKMTSVDSLTVSPHENRPPYYALAYIMKVI